MRGFVAGAVEVIVVLRKIVERHLDGDRFLVNLPADVIVQDFALDEKQNQPQRSPASGGCPHQTDRPGQVPALGQRPPYDATDDRLHGEATVTGELSRPKRRATEPTRPNASLNRGK